MCFTKRKTKQQTMANHQGKCCEVKPTLITSKCLARKARAKFSLVDINLLVYANATLQ